MQEIAELENPADVSIRPVDLADSLLLLHWRNNPDVRKWSHDSNEISLDTHEMWLSAWTSEQRRRGYFFVIEYLGKSAGMVRFDMIASDTFEVSVLVEPDYQGKGIAKRAISVAINQITTDCPAFTLIASIHERNLASINLFKKLDFWKSGKTENFLEFSRNFFFEDV